MNRQCWIKCPTDPERLALVTEGIPGFQPSEYRWQDMPGAEGAASAAHAAAVLNDHMGISREEVAHIVASSWFEEDVQHLLNDY